MTENIYKVKGSFKMGRNPAQSFTKELIANDEKDAQERTLSNIGSKHGIARRDIKIGEVKKIKSDQVTDIVVKSMLSKK